MSVDRQLQEQVLAALEREPGVEAGHVGVSVLDGVVTLQGTVATFRQKWLAERAARLASGRRVANALEVARRGGIMNAQTLALLGAMVLAAPGLAAADGQKCCAKDGSHSDHATAAQPPASHPPASTVEPHATGVAPYQIETEGLFTGIVHSVMRHSGMDLELTIGVGEKNVEVLVAPVAWLDAKNAVFRPGERIEIVGARSDRGTGDTIVAREIHTVDQTIVVRDTEGRPLWN